MAGGQYQRTPEQVAADKAIVALVTARLAANAESYGRQYLPGAGLAGNCLQAASLGGGAGSSFVLWIRGEKAGEFHDFHYGGADGRGQAGGNMLDFLAYHEFGGDWGKAISHYRSTFGLDDRDPARIAKVIREAAVLAEKTERENSAAEVKKRTRAQLLWKGAVPIHRTPAEAYLRMRVPGWEALGDWPVTLRYRPDVNYCPVRGSGPERTGYPAMLAAVVGSDGKLCAVHGTFLDISDWDHARKQGPVRVHKVIRPLFEAVDEHGEVHRRQAKAELFDPLHPKAGKIKSHKATLGRYHHVGGYIPLRGGGAADKWMRDIPAGAVPHFSEGIEDGLNYAVDHPEAWIGAAVSLANMANVWLPSQAGGVCFLADRDPAENEDALASFEAAVAAQQARRDDPEFVRAVWPAPGFKDFSDQAVGKRL